MTGQAGANLTTAAYMHYRSLQLCNCGNDKRRERSFSTQRPVCEALFASFQRARFAIRLIQPTFVGELSFPWIFAEPLPSESPISSARTSSAVGQSACRSSCFDGVATKPEILSAGPRMASLCQSPLRYVPQVCVPGVGTLLTNFVSNLCPSL